jgi:K+-sensing histidine kinase KdpD
MTSLIYMKSTIFMTLIYMIIGACATFVWFNVNILIIDNMNEKACTTDKKSSTVESVQSLYTWLTIVLVICFVGVVRGIRGFADGWDVYDIKDIFSIIFIAGTIGTIFTGTMYVRANPVVSAMTTNYPLTTPTDKTNTNSIPANTTVTTILNVMTIISGIATVGILYKGKQIVDPPKEKAPTAAEAATSAHEYGPSHYDPHATHGHGN